MKIQTYILLSLCLTACGSVESLYASPCVEFASTKSVSLRLVHKDISTAQGVTGKMGTFEIYNQGIASIVLGGYKDNTRFSLWHPVAWLQRKTSDGSWQELSDSYSDVTLPAPDTLVVKKGSRQLFIAMIQTSDAAVDPTTEVRLVIQGQNRGLCIASNAFAEGN